MKFLGECVLIVPNLATVIPEDISRKESYRRLIIETIVGFLTEQGKINRNERHCDVYLQNATRTKTHLCHSLLLIVL